MKHNLETYLKAIEKNKGNVTAAARSLNISRATFRVRMCEFAINKKSELITVEEEHKLKIQLREMSKQNQKLIAESARAGDVAEIVQKIAVAPSTPPKWVSKKPKKKADTAIITAILSDCHFDEVVLPEQVNYVNGYNRNIATMRLQQFFQNTIKLSNDYINGIKVEGLVLGLLGDMVSGNIHEELKETNEETIIDTCLYYADHIIAGIDLLLEHFPKIFIPCVVGNHGRMDRKPKHKNRAKESFDYLIYNLVARAFQNTKEVTFGISEGADYRYTVYDTRYQVTHGDQFRGGGGIAGLLSPLMIGDHRKRKREQAVGTPYDYLVMGHWHQLAHFKGIIVNGSLKGYDEYAANSNFDFEPPQQALWLTDPHHGKTIDAPIHVLDKAEYWLELESENIVLR